MLPRHVTTTYLQMGTPKQLRPARDSGLAVREAVLACPELSRFLYAAVGCRWYWTDRRSWDYEQWAAHLAQPSVRTWVGYLEGNPAGYFELAQQEDRSVKIAYFGLLPQFFGQGHGGTLLTAAIQQAWGWGATRVWVHTNTLDGPYALKNYRARGLVIYRQTQAQVLLPDQPPTPW